MKSAVSLYVHIPFCVKKCLFCSFAVAIAQTKRVDDYLNALNAEAENYDGDMLKTIYVGGGTPSFLSGDQIKRLVDIIRSRFVIADGAEWTIEINPESIDGEKADVLKGAGFTRVSLGIQSFNDAYLKFLGRNHGRAQAVHAFDVLRRAGFGNINVDLMYGFPQQTRDELLGDLRAAVDLRSEHVSIYTLTVEPNSRFFARQMKLDADDKLADDYVCVTGWLEQAGIPQYEVSNFSRPGFESRHNTVYWEGGDYIGLGMGAHSLRGNKRSWNKDHLMDYLGDMDRSGSAVEASEELTPQTRFMERVIFGLRMNRGINMAQLEATSGLTLTPDRKILIDDFIRDGFLCQENDFIKTTPQGRLVLDDLASRLI